MKYEIKKTTYKEFLKMMSDKNTDFSIQSIGGYIQDENYIVFFEYNNDGNVFIGCQVGDDGHTVEQFIENSIGVVKWSPDYGAWGEFKPLALIIDGEFVGVSIEIETIVRIEGSPIDANMT